MSQEGKNTENRLLAALSHGAIVAQGIGFLVGVLVYFNQREKSRFAAYQGLQAAVFQLLNLIVTVVLWIAWGVFYSVTIVQLIKLEDANPDAAPPPLFWVSLVSVVIPLIYMIFTGLYGLWGGLRSWKGEDFRYLLIGNWLEKSGLWKVESIAEEID